MLATKQILIIFFSFCSSQILGQNQTLVMADKYFNLGNYAKAINEYSKLGSLEAQHQIARAYDAMGNYSKAIAQYKAVIKIDSASTLAQFELGKIYDKTKRYEDAQIVFKSLTVKNLDNPEFFYYLGKAHQELKNYKVANQALVKAVELDSTHLRSIYLLGKYYVAVEEPQNAQRILDLGLQSAPNDVALINLKALAYYNNGQYREAIPHFEKLIQLGEEKAFVHEKLAFSYFRDWEFDRAREQYHKLSSYPQKAVKAFDGLAAVFLREKKLDSAEHYIEKSIAERTPNFAMEYADLGRIARLRGHTKKAMKNYYRAWEEYPENPMFYYQFCTLADEYYKDPQIKLKHYEKLLSDFDELVPFIKERAKKRITELKEEIHFSKK